MSNIGRVIYGFCNGYFGRDDYKTKIIVFETSVSICCRYLDKNEYLTCAIFDSEEEKQRCIDEWSNSKEVD